MTLIDTRAADGHPSHRASLFARVWTWLAELIADVCATEDAPADPTAQFTSHEWADMPAWHPAADDE